MDLFAKFSESLFTYCSHALLKTVKMIRISPKIELMRLKTKNAVILQHGMGGSGEGWLYQLRGKTPMINYFAEAGFDIWIQNNRGTKYSQEHDLYTTDDREFWQMDWSTYGTIDFPLLVSFIQERTGVKKVAMVGHSQGTTQTFAGMGLIPKWYDENVSVAALLGPCTCPN